jgi:MoxR-like ATPase
MDAPKFQQLFERLVSNVSTVIHGKDDVIRLALVALTANGHILFEDVPGVGKSMLARALGASMNMDINRIQCTPDMLPSDITGSSIIEQKARGGMNFVFRAGPVFTNVLLIDEINRATPKTQSALLEAMAERNVTVEGTTHKLPDPFLCLATQNPVEQAGTFSLPEAQLDRFMFRLSMGYPGLEAERLVLRGNARGLEVEELKPVCDPKDVLNMIDFAADTHINNAVETYILEIVQATRQDASFLMAASPRATIALARASKALAASDGRADVYPEDVKALLKPVLNHRVVLTPDALLRGETVDEVLDRVVSRIKAPAGVSESGGTAKRKGRQLAMSAAS